MTYKPSRYAVSCDADSGEKLLFNTSTGRFAVCSPLVYQSFLDGEGPFASQLSQAGFLVEDVQAELDLQRQRFYSFRHDRSKLHLALAPTYACNCKCVYCYEQDKATAKSRMSRQVIDAVYSFVQERFKKDEFVSLFVEWYGGDPQLCLDIVEEMAQWFMEFCSKNDIAYDSLMLSNSTLIGEQEAQLIADSGVTTMMVTIDGPEEVHNARRPANGIDNPYQNIMNAIEALQKQGVSVTVAVNADKVNLPLVPQMRKELGERFNVPVSPAKLNDYAHTYGCGAFSKPGFELYTHEEYAYASYEILSQSGMDRDQIAAMLKPADHFCTGHMESSYVIDAFGDVYKCDGWMGDKRRALFNLLDGSEPVHNNVTFDPFEHDDCSNCELLPLCWGNCSWERELCGWPCHPLKHTMGSFLRDYRATFGDVEGEFVVLA